VTSLPVLLLVCGLFAAIAGFILAGARRTTAAKVQRSASLRTILRCLAAAALCATLWLAGRWLGWEVGIPAWLGLLSVAAVAGLYLAAVSRRALLAAAGVSAFTFVTGAAGTLFLRAMP
jgi:hypothetical protein